ncbi:YihY/virulence factor BrkB family protein [Alicyclobacillus acidocaldarius]|uniref:Ribonuclease BN n=1 Tax=Alicyclobacillus acidocaldarius (strain Tc-4-1) TaxID=1048834 RepID=F8IFV6_ALIAT|nr:YihY/virulence factor BrkB family protein [Alicyclobacillus acidocaldarius]AEJ42927.1 ribonuclease BN [Alicyclobacillus acidocaldarius subsp. acidocaldarius Tc-4-1]
MRTRFQQAQAFARRLGANCLAHDITSLAAQISFYAMFSLLPLLVLVMYGASLVVPHRIIVEMVLGALRPYYPDLQNANQMLENSLNKLSDIGARAGFVSFLSLAWSATSALIAVQQALDRIFEVGVPRSFLARRAIAALFLVALVIVAVVSALAMAIYPWVVHHIPAGTWLVTAFTRFSGVTRVLYPLSLFVTCFVVYRYLPSRRVNLNCTILGALAATVLLDLARLLFVVYAAHAVTYHAVYGGLTVVILLIFWMYIALIILLLSAEIAWLLEQAGGDPGGAEP